MELNCKQIGRCYLLHNFIKNEVIVENRVVSRDSKMEKDVEVVLCRLFADLNEESSKAWADEKHLSFSNIKVDGEAIELDIGIGKWETTYHTVVMDSEGWRVVKQSVHNDILEDVMHYFIMPEFFSLDRN